MIMDNKYPEELELAKQSAEKALTKLLVPTEEEIQKKKNRFKVQEDVNDFFPEEVALAATATQYELGVDKYPWWLRTLNTLKIIKYHYFKQKEGKAIKKHYYRDFRWRFYDKLSLFFQNQRRKSKWRIDLYNREVEVKRKPKQALPNEV